MTQLIPLAVIAALFAVVTLMIPAEVRNEAADLVRQPPVVEAHPPSQAGPESASVADTRVSTPLPEIPRAEVVTLPTTERRVPRAVIVDEQLAVLGFQP